MVMPAVADVVVIELPAEHAQHALDALDGCRLVLGRERCRSTLDDGPPPTFYAIVRWQAQQPLLARVELHSESAEGPVLSARDVTFSSDDTFAQRYRALGLLVVSYVIAEEARKADAERPEPETVAVAQPQSINPPRDAVAVGSSAGVTTPTLGAGVDVAGHWGTGATSGFARGGAFLRPWLGPLSDAWRPFGRVGWSTESDVVQIRSYEGALGVALCFDVVSALRVEVSASAVLQHLRYSVSDASLGTDRAALTRYGVRFGTEAHFRLTEHAGVWFGIEVLAASPPYTVEVKSVRLAQEQGPTGAGLIGLRLQR
jgi:hypothetical protein